MESRLVTVLLCLALAACGAVSCPDRFLAHGDREPNGDELAYTEIAAGSGSGQPCERISPQAYRLDESAERGMQVILERSRCYALAAVTSGEAGFCDHVETVSTLLYDGSDFDASSCRRHATGGSNSGGEPPDLEHLMLRLDLAPDLLADRCEGYLGDRRVRQRAAEQDAYVTCMQRRPEVVREHPDEPLPICTGPYNLLERFEDCVAQRTAAVERDARSFPSGWIDRCRLFMRHVTPEKRHFDLCVDEEKLRRHRSPGEYAKTAKQSCRDETLTRMRASADWGEHRYCTSFVGLHPGTFQWGLHPEPRLDSEARYKIYRDLLASGEILSRLDRLPDYSSPN